MYIYIYIYINIYIYIYIFNFLLEILWLKKTESFRYNNTYYNHYIFTENEQNSIKQKTNMSVLFNEFDSE